LKREGLPVHPAEAIIWFCIVVGVLFLITQRWFWLLAFFTAGLASCFAMLASIIYFQILGAVGFFFLMAVCWLFVAGIAQAGR
jgi:hypothetical protein